MREARYLSKVILTHDSDELLAMLFVQMHEIARLVQQLFIVIPVVQTVQVEGREGGYRLHLMLRYDLIIETIIGFQSETIRSLQGQIHTRPVASHDTAKIRNYHGQ